MLSKIVKWLFQLPGRLFGGIFRSRLTIFIFFMLIAVGVFSTKRYLRAHQNDDEFVSITPTDYNRAIQREMPLRRLANSAEARCMTMPDNPGPRRPVTCINQSTKTAVACSS